MSETKSKDPDLYRIHVMLLNSERSTIWQRFSAFLVANSVLLAFLKGHPLLLPIVGLIFSALWLVIHLAGYRLFHGQLDTITNDFEIDPLPGSPWYGRGDRRKPFDWIRNFSVALICAFMGVHLYLLGSEFGCFTAS